MENITKIEAGQCIDELGEEATQKHLDQWIAYLQRQLGEQYPNTNVSVYDTKTNEGMLNVTPNDAGQYEDVAGFIEMLFDTELEKAFIDLSAEILTHAENFLDHHGIHINTLAKEFFNCQVAEVDTHGDLWIEGPQAGHWLTDVEKENFLAWLVSREV